MADNGNDDVSKQKSNEEKKASIFFGSRASRLVLLSIVVFFVFLSYFICNTRTNIKALSDSDTKFRGYATFVSLRLAGSILVIIGCIGIFYLKITSKEILNTSAGVGLRLLPALLFIFGALTLFIGTILTSRSGIEVIKESLGDQTITCGNFTSQPFYSQKRDEIRLKAVGVNVCFIPYAYDSILWGIALIMGLDLLLVYIFRRPVRISFYSIILIAFVILFSVFGYSMYAYCDELNRQLKIETAEPTRATFTPSFNPVRLPTPPPVTLAPQQSPTLFPTRPSLAPIVNITVNPSTNPTTPTMIPTRITRFPSRQPTKRPTFNPSSPTLPPTKFPSRNPSTRPTGFPTFPTIGFPTFPTTTSTTSLSPTPNPSRAPITAESLLKCSNFGYFRASTNGLWSSDPAWALGNYGNAAVLILGVLIIGIGAVLAFFYGLMGCSCLRSLVALILVLGGILVFIVGQTVGENTGYLGYIYTPCDIKNSNSCALSSNIFPATSSSGGWTGATSCNLFTYSYWILILFICWFIACEILNL